MYIQRLRTTLCLTGAALLALVTHVCIAWGSEPTPPPPPPPTHMVPAAGGILIVGGLVGYGIWRLRRRN